MKRFLFAAALLAAAFGLAACVRKEAAPEAEPQDSGPVQAADPAEAEPQDGGPDGTVRIANPWREITEAEAREICPHSFSVPEGARDARWSVMEAAADPSGVPGALVQLAFELDGNRFTAREQVTGGEEADLSGMYYKWTAQLDGTLKNWDGAACTNYRWIGESGYADLCVWQDAEAGVSYSVSVTAEDLDGFDLQAVAELLHP